jgi:hypothetical protein
MNVKQLKNILSKNPRTLVAAIIGGILFVSTVAAVGMQVTGVGFDNRQQASDTSCTVCRSEGGKCVRDENGAYLECKISEAVLPTGDDAPEKLDKTEKTIQGKDARCKKEMGAGYFWNGNKCILRSKKGTTTGGKVNPIPPQVKPMSWNCKCEGNTSTCTKLGESYSGEEITVGYQIDCEDYGTTCKKKSGKKAGGQCQTTDTFTEEDYKDVTVEVLDAAQREVMILTLGGPGSVEQEAEARQSTCYDEEVVSVPLESTGQTAMFSCEEGCSDDKCNEWDEDLVNP